MRKPLVDLLATVCIFPAIVFSWVIGSSDCTQNFMPRAEGNVDISSLGTAVGDTLHLDRWTFDVLLGVL